MILEKKNTYVPVTYCCITNHFRRHWLEIIVLIYFAHESVIWVGLGGNGLSLLLATSAEMAQRGLVDPLPRSQPCDEPVDRDCSWGCQPGFWFLSMWASLGLPFSRAPRLQEKHPKRQEVGAANLFRPGLRSWHCVSPILFYCLSSDRAHLDSRGGDLDRTSQ